MDAQIAVDLGAIVRNAAALAALPPDAPVLVSYCDYGMVWDPAAFERFANGVNSC